ncbi:LCP family protein [Nocardia callitridis]|uniref:LCP family protein n=1 Tax=Nocardia callitridis TaxID=648753 RepID=A0ABP9KUS9_9NOCA
MDDATVPIPQVGDRWPQRREPTRAAKRRAAPKRRRSRGARAAQVGIRVMSVACALTVLGGTGFAWSAKSNFDQGFTRSDAIGADEPHSLGGDLNVLLIGLDTRKDLNGNDLPQEVLDQLHAGDSDNGGYNANSLILLHIPANLEKIVAFSIPRDNYVPVTGIPGYDHAKIKEAYGLRKAVAQQKLADSGEDDPVELERQGREAGRASIVSTVRNLVGVPIDRFAEVSLASFYDLATALGGVDVCLNHAVDDSYFSGAVFPAGPQHLDGAQSLAFVRQRHGLENQDLDRTHRQQAFLTSIAKSLKDSGTLTNLSKLSDLMDVAHRDVVLSDGWDLLDFARTMGSAGAIPVEFRTLPVLRFDVVDGQDVNIIDPSAIRKEVRTAFGEQQPEADVPHTPTSTVDVYNAGGVSGLAGELSSALTEKGYEPGELVTDTIQPTSTILYGPGGKDDAEQLASTLGAVALTESPKVEAGHVRVVIGSDFSMPSELTAESTGVGAETSTQTTANEPAPDHGTPVTTTIGNTVPCVN